MQLWISTASKKGNAAKNFKYHKHARIDDEFLSQYIGFQCLNYKIHKADKL